VAPKGPRKEFLKTLIINLKNRVREAIFCNSRISNWLFDWLVKSSRFDFVLTRWRWWIAQSINHWLRWNRSGSYFSRKDAFSRKLLSSEENLYPLFPEISSNKFKALFFSKFSSLISKRRSTIKNSSLTLKLTSHVVQFLSSNSFGGRNFLRFKCHLFHLFQIVRQKRETILQNSSASYRQISGRKIFYECQNTVFFRNKKPSFDREIDLSILMSVLPSPRDVFERELEWTIDDELAKLAIQQKSSKTW